MITLSLFGHATYSCLKYFCWSLCWMLRLPVLILASRIFIINDQYHSVLSIHNFLWQSQKVIAWLWIKMRTSSDDSISKHRKRKVSIKYLLTFSKSINSFSSFASTFHCFHPLGACHRICCSRFCNTYQMDSSHHLTMLPTSDHYV